jgi:hypothetical protein
MPSGERSQVWYPHLVALLRASWHRAITWDEVVSLRAVLQAEFDEYRSQRGIVPAVIRCRECGEIGPAAAPKISVRAMLIALRRFGIASDHDSQQREREWARYRASKSLDLYGLEQGEERHGAHGCPTRTLQLTRPSLRSGPRS